MGSRPPQRTYRRGGGFENRRGGGGSSSGSNRRERKRSDSGEEIVNRTNGWDLILRDDDDILTGDLRKYNIDPVTRVIRRPGPSINPAAREAHQRVIDEIMAEEAERAKQAAMKEQHKKENRRGRRGGGRGGGTREFSGSENGEQHQQRGSSSSGAYSQASPGFGGVIQRSSNGGGGGATPFDFDRRYTSGRVDTAAPSSFGSLTPQHQLPHRDPSPYGRLYAGQHHQNVPFQPHFDDASIRGGGGGSFNGSNGHFGGHGPPTLQEPPPPWQRQYTPAPSPFQGHPDYAAIRESVLRELDSVLCNHCRYCRCRGEFRHGTAVEQNHHQQQLQLPYQPQQSEVDSASLHGYALNEFQTGHDQTSLRSTNSRLNREPPFRPIDATWPSSQQAQNQEGPNAVATEGELNYQRDNASATWDTSADGIRRGVELDNREQIHGQPQDECMLAAENTVLWEADVERAAAYRQVEEFRHGADPRTEYRRPDYERYGLGAEGREEPVMNYDGSIASSSEPRTDWTTNSSSGSSRANRRKNNNNKKKKGRNSTSEGCRPATDLRKDDSEDDDGKDGWRGRRGGGGGGTQQGGGAGGGGHTTQGVGALTMAVERIMDLDGVDAAEDLDDERMQPCCSRYDTSTVRLGCGGGCGGVMMHPFLSMAIAIFVATSYTIYSSLRPPMHPPLPHAPSHASPRFKHCASFLILPV